ncbi:MAG: hypothetical protein LBU58_03695, partial [Clostridiales bacterium]|nr:hypothetical protein [Clostridiales bacterium]
AAPSDAASREKTVVVATASPYKFARDVYQSIFPDAPAAAQTSAAADDFRYIALLERASGTTAPPALSGLRGRPGLHFASTAKDRMKQTALDLLLKL